VLLTGCFCIGPGIDSRLAVLAHRPVGLRANTADRESIPGPIQKQPVRSDPGRDHSTSQSVPGCRIGGLISIVGFSGYNTEILIVDHSG
jgi:hypothetical protein